MEVSLAWLPFEREALQRAELIDVGGFDIPVALAEDLVIYKIVAWRDRDRTDVERLLRAYPDDIDLSRVRRIIAEFAAALDEPERLEDMERLLAKVRAPARRGPER
jgi:predicted nucleotidyltransferase